jgi:hypothetical protein
VLAELVVALTLLRIREDLVGFPDLLVLTPFVPNPL